MGYAVILHKRDGGGNICSIFLTTELLFPCQMTQQADQARGASRKEEKNFFSKKFAMKQKHQGDPQH